MEEHSPNRKTPGGKKAKFASESVKTAAKVPYTDTIESPSKFCGLLQKRIGLAKVCLQVRSGKLIELEKPRPVDDIIADERGVSLEDVLGRYNLVSKEKLLLAYVIARSFWQFYASAWMDAQWTTGTVQFFRHGFGDDDDDDNDDSSGRPLLNGSPYVTLPIEKGDPHLSAEYLPPSYVLHRYPRILSLGSLLLEIGHRGGSRNKRSTRGAARPRNYLEKINALFTEIRYATDTGVKGWPDFNLQEEVKQTYRLIVRNCSDGDLFAGEQANTLATEKEGLTIEERRAILYRRVVHPLKELLERLGWIDEAGNIRNQGTGEEGNGNGSQASNGCSRMPGALLSDIPGSEISRSRSASPIISSNPGYRYFLLC